MDLRRFGGCKGGPGAALLMQKAVALIRLEARYGSVARRRRLARWLAVAGGLPVQGRDGSRRREGGLLSPPPGWSVPREPLPPRPRRVCGGGDEALQHSHLGNVPRFSPSALGGSAASQGLGPSCSQGSPHDPSGLSMSIFAHACPPAVPKGPKTAH